MGTSVDTSGNHDCPSYNSYVTPQNLLKNVISNSRKDKRSTAFVITSVIIFSKLYVIITVCVYLLLYT